MVTIHNIRKKKRQQKWKIKTRTKALKKDIRLKETRRELSHTNKDMDLARERLKETLDTSDEIIHELWGALQKPGAEKAMDEILRTGRKMNNDLFGLLHKPKVTTPEIERLQNRLLNAIKQRSEIENELGEMHSIHERLAKKALFLDRNTALLKRGFQRSAFGPGMRWENWKKGQEIKHHSR